MLVAAYCSAVCKSDNTSILFAYLFIFQDFYEVFLFLVVTAYIYFELLLVIVGFEPNTCNNTNNCFVDYYFLVSSEWYACIYVNTY